MEFLTNVIIAIFTAYLSFTNFLAGEIIEFLEPVDDTATIIETSTSSNEEIKIPSLPTDFPYQNIIPNILINNPEYQKASLLDSTEIINATTNDPLVAIVNIYCTYTTSTFLRTTTGTGFFVSPGGVILTNAHVAQFFLLENTDALGNT
ncbi:trypsin-like peptidase domain-containing protein, partial [Candidatus Kaiserbacteria bacterium]|nr:trypsin-like peptidase domain-containing protein [Candidatus Kaiserbacteria bacterium]